MTGQEIAIIITATATLVTSVITSIATLIVALRTKHAIDEVHVATNSLTDRLVQTTKTEAHAAGVLEEKNR